jgi:hypothetical protein
VTAILDTIILAVFIVFNIIVIIVVVIVLYTIVVVVSIRIVSAFDVTVLAPGQILRFNSTELQEKYLLEQVGEEERDAREMRQRREWSGGARIHSRG